MIPWGFVLRIAGPLIVAGLVYGFGYSAGSANVTRKWDAEKARMMQSAFEMSERARLKEQELQAKVTEANNARTIERQKHERIAADLKRDADFLRDDIAKFAGGSAEESAPACRERAATLGRVLDGVLQDYRACTAGAESASADLRAVISAWPRK